MGNAFGRRQLLAEAAGFAATAVGHAVAQARHAPRRQILSCSLLSANILEAPVNQLTTFLMTLPLEAPVQALRVGMANVSPEPYTLQGICCCEGSQWNPAAGSEWAYFSFTGAGTGEEPRAPARTRQSCVVPGNQPTEAGATNVPRIYWSDWMRYQTRAASGPPQMLFRALVPPQRLSLTETNVRGDWAGLVSGLRSWTTGWWQLPGDFVTQPVSPTPRPRDSNLAPIYVIQYRAAVPGIQIVIGGDSHLARWHTFVRLAAINLSTPELPISTWNAAMGGVPSRSFLPSLEDAIDAARPSVCLIKGWTPNDVMGRKHDLAYEDRVRQTAARVTQQGGLTIILKSMPVHLADKPGLLAEWQLSNHELDHLVPGALVFDPNPYVEDPQKPGNWRPGASDDGLHPNVAGETLLRDPFENMLRPWL